MPTTNADIAAAFGQVADLLELQDANPFRVRAWRNAARVIGDLKLDVTAQVAAGRPLPKLPGIGADLESKLREIALTGHLTQLDRLRRAMPAGIADLLRLPGLGPRRVRALYDELHVHTLPQLLRAARDQRIRELPGFGATTEQKIAAAIDKELGKSRRFKLAVAVQYADALIAWLRQAPGAGAVVAAGSLRRARETVGDVDLLVTAADGAAVVRHFVGHPDVADVLQAGDTRATIVLKSGLQADLRVVPPDSYGAALLYFTGSKAHNIRLRTRALERGLKLNEYGLFRGRGTLPGEAAADAPSAVARRGAAVSRIAGDTEASVYEALGLPWIPPELREDRGEIEAALHGRLPALIEIGALRGDLHVHTKWSDGTATIGQMAEAARARGLSYVAISEHSRRLTVARGLDPERLLKQRGEIERIRATLAGFTLLTGIECDVLDDGSLDLPDSALAPLDVVIAAVHSKFDLPRARQTRRVLAALDNPHVRILAHPLGRLIDRREPYDIDMLAVIRKCRQRRIALELNAHPERLDLLDIHCRMARDEGAQVAINSDAHSVHEYDHLAYGIGQARRGWLEAADVVNTRPVGDVLAWLRAGR
jgi:DNA polymerase (family 10)